mgnify:CR=1 FL=1
MNRKKRYWGDKMKDANSEEKNENKQREQRFYSEAFKVWGGGCKNELAGLLMEAGPFAEEEKKRLMQENHSARHALWYLAMIVYFITSDHPGLATGQKTARVLGHLICLREFLRTDQLRLRIVVRRLAEAVFSENPDYFETPIPQIFNYQVRLIVKQFVFQFILHKIWVISLD